MLWYTILKVYLCWARLQRPTLRKPIIVPRRAIIESLIMNLAAVFPVSIMVS